jgi:hypothetical protein
VAQFNTTIGLKEKCMEYDLKAMDLEIKTIEKRTKRLKKLAYGFEAVERNTDAILTFVYLFRKNVSDVIE